MKTFPLFLFALFFLARAGVAQDQVIYDDALENGWQDESWATVNFTNTTPVHGGNDSISVVDNTSNYEALYLHHAAFADSGYQSLTFWVYPTVAGNNQMYVQATLNGAAQPGTLLSFTQAQVNKWQQVTIPLSTLGVANKSNFDGFWIQNNTGGAMTFYVDDVSLVAVAPPNPVLVSVNATSVTRIIDGRIYGLNSAIWDSQFTTAASGPLLAQMGTQAVRIPGGSAADEYDWQTDKSVTDSSYQWAANAAIFAQTISGAGAQAYVTVNYGSGTPQQAAAWVAYYNGAPSSTTSIGTDSKGRNWQTVGYWATMRASAPLATDDGYNFLRISHPAAFGFKYWEIGNECYGDWEYDLHGTSGSGLPGSPQDPYTYAQVYQSFYNAMLAVDPTVRIGAVAVTGEDSYGNGQHAVANPNESNSLHSGWTPVMLNTLKTLGVTPHFLICHDYPQSTGSENDAALLQDGATTASDATNLRQMINSYFGTSAGAGIELAMTELNSVDTDPGKQSVSLVNGLFMADALGQLASTEFNACLWWDFRNGSETDNNNSASLYGWRQFGDYGMVASGDRGDTPLNTPYPPAQAAALLTHWGRGGDSVVAASSNYSLLSTYVAKLANGNLALLVINKHPSADLPTQITLGNFTPMAGAATYYTYGKPNDLAVSGITTGAFTPGSSTFTYTFPSYSMTVLVIQPSGEPMITVANSPVQAAANQSFNYQISASGSPTSYNATGLPNGLGVNTTTGVISGTPTANGTYNVTLSAGNAIGTNTSQLTIVVSNAVPALPAWGRG